MKRICILLIQLIDLVLKLTRIIRNCKNTISQVPLGSCVVISNKDLRTLVKI